MGVPNTAVIASGDPATRAAVRSAALERFTRLIAGADSATSTLAAWTHRRRDGTVLCQARAIVWLDSPALPGPVVAGLRTGPQSLGELLGPLGLRRRTLRASRRYDYRRPLAYDDQDRAVLVVSAALDVAHERVALVEETYLEPVLW
jgi:hypothetical protein